MVQHRGVSLSRPDLMGQRTEDVPSERNASKSTWGDAMAMYGRQVRHGTERAEAEVRCGTCLRPTCLVLGIGHSASCIDFYRPALSKGNKGDD